MEVSFVPDRLEVPAYQQQINFNTVHIFQVRQRLVDLVQFSMATALNSNLHLVTNVCHQLLPTTPERIWHVNLSKVTVPVRN